MKIPLAAPRAQHPRFPHHLRFAGQGRRAASCALAAALFGASFAAAGSYIGDISDLCAYSWLAGSIDACQGGGHFILFGSNYQDVFAFVVLILVLVFRPQGLLGERVGDRA